MDLQSLYHEQNQLLQQISLEKNVTYTIKSTGT